MKDQSKLKNHLYKLLMLKSKRMYKLNLEALNNPMYAGLFSGIADLKQAVYYSFF